MADSAALIAAARQALAARQPGQARHLLLQAERAPPLLLAQACHLAGDRAGEEAALRQALAANPRDIAALMAMAELAAGDGRERHAVLWYRAALNQAAVTPPPPAAASALGRAQAYVAAAGARFAAHLEAAVGADARLPRIAQALDLLAGRRQLHFQQPSLFYFPGLAQRSFFDRAEFPWLADLEAETDALVAELEAAMASPGCFRPYVETPADRPAPNNPLRDDPSWSAGWLWEHGARNPAIDAPRTFAALERAPMPRIVGRSPSALWSLLRPGTRIEPHHGLLNTRLIVHLPLIPAPDCGLRVGADTRQWTRGEALVFDDSIEHEAWNRGPATRVVLLFEIWRPDIEPAERDALTRLFETIDRFGGAAESGGAL